MWRDETEADASLHFNVAESEFPKRRCYIGRNNAGNDIWEYLAKNLTMHAKGYKHAL